MLKISIVFLSLALSFGASAQSTPPGKFLHCKGGAGTIGLTTSKRGQSKTAYYYFEKALRAADEGLENGQCAFINRRVYQSEPTCLTQVGSQGTAWIFPNGRKKGYIKSPTHPWIEALQKMNGRNEVTFQVYKPQTGGCFVVTGLHIPR